MLRIQKDSFLRCKSLCDVEELAKTLLLPHRYSYFAYKAGQGCTYNDCREYFEKRLRLIPRMMIDVSNISIQTTIFGKTYESPIIIAPTAFHCLAHIDGEFGTARGATEAGCIYTYNWLYATVSESTILETKGPKFLHLYLTIPENVLERVVSQASEKGYLAIVITCDDSTTRVRDVTLPIFIEASQNDDPNISNVMRTPNMNTDELFEGVYERKPPITWTMVKKLRKLTKLPLICKGILSPYDAELAIECGADGIVVSNHGCRLIDTSVPAIECLKDVVDTVNGRIEVFLDSGIRTGTDIVKALAIGAKAVFIGRPILYGLSCGGHNGVRKVLEILKSELSYDMAYCGIPSINQLNRELLWKY